MLTDFRNSFADRLNGKFATNSYLNIPPHLKTCRYTTLWNMKVGKLAAIWKIYCDISQGSIAKHLSCDGLLHYTFVIQFGGEHFFKSVNIWRSYRQNGWLSYAQFVLDFYPERCRTQQIRKITCVWRTETVTNNVVMLIGRLTWVYYQQISNCWRPVLSMTDCWSCTAFCCNIFLQ